jgi:hypothetical protein
MPSKKVLSGNDREFSQWEFFLTLLQISTEAHGLFCNTRTFHEAAKPSNTRRGDQASLGEINWRKFLSTSNSENNQTK